MYSSKPRSLRALTTCSAAMVFLASFSAISLASEEIRVMNSTQHSINRSRASLAKERSLERISCMIFWTVAGWEDGGWLEIIWRRAAGGFYL